MKQKLIVILGPTAVGKTKFGVELADRFNGEIISADSRQVYKRMDIGTGKDLSDYKIGNRQIPCHLIDILDPTEEFDLFKFQKSFKEVYTEITVRQRIPFLVGGTALYIHSILKNYQLTHVDFTSSRRIELQQLSIDELKTMLSTKISKLHNTTDLIEKERMIKAILISENQDSVSEEVQNEFTFLVIGLMDNRESIKSNITDRLKYRLQNGMIEEVEALVEYGITFEKLDYFGLEYKFIGKYIKGELSYNDMYQKLNSAIHKFAKRQMTWFRKMEREGIEIHWVDKNNKDNVHPLIENFLSV
ncbi:MAG: tRNA (adenosine(37)-N6)-dimethylallyltransferase MiaA [Bacteroidota bacterium]